jgi:hypothetical protein
MKKLGIAVRDAGPPAGGGPFANGPDRRLAGDRSTIDGLLALGR